MGQKACREEITPDAICTAQFDDSRCFCWHYNVSLKDAEDTANTCPYQSGSSGQPAGQEQLLRGSS